MAYDRINKGYSLKTTVGGFLFGCLWGAISIGTWFELRYLLVTLMERLDPNVWAHQWRDQITLIGLGLLWLIGVMLVWNRSEHNLVQKRPIISTLKYTFWSLVVFGIALVINMFFL